MLYICMYIFSVYKQICWIHGNCAVLPQNVNEINMIIIVC